MTYFTDRARRALTAVAAITISATTAVAEIRDYAFQLDSSEMKAGQPAIVSVRLIDKRSGKAVPDAVIFAVRIDMAPDGMPTMAAPIKAEPSIDPGTYRFSTTLTMEGGWQLSLAAKVQGETGTVESRLILKATP